MTEAASEIRRAAHLPEQPGQTFGARTRLGREKRAEFFGKIQENRAGLENADWFRSAAVHERWNFGIGVHGDEAAAELVAFADADEPRIIFGASVSERQK